MGLNLGLEGLVHHAAWGSIIKTSRQHFSNGKTEKLQSLACFISIALLVVRAASPSTTHFTSENIFTAAAGATSAAVPAEAAIYYNMSQTLGADMRVSFSPNYSYIFAFERNFDKQSRRQWMLDNWHTVFYYIAAYMILVFGGQALMSLRPRFELRRFLATWNIFLAVFSIIGALRTFPELVYVLKQFGFHHSVCNPSYIEENKVSGFWTWMFTLSKVPELGDTIFIVLRKQNLIFLHWYHHITVCLYCWYTYKEHIAMGRWFVCMNYSVHSVMYTYYALRALKFRVPRWVAMFITMSQIAQMVVGCYVSIYGYQARGRGEACVITQDIAKLSLLMYFSYFVLFAKLFYNNYFPSSRAPTKYIKKDQ